MSSLTPAITFIADKVKLNGPKVDNSFSITFETGEYVWDMVKELPNMNGKTLKITVEEYTE